MITIAREPMFPGFEEAAPLLAKHWNEIASFHDIDLDPDVERYRAIEAAGALRVFAARDDGRLVGYACYIVAPHGHYKGSLQAIQDVFYVDPQHRGRTIGVRLMRYADDSMRAEGVQLVMQHVKLAHPDLGRLARLSGYRPIETIYAKRLDREGT